MVHCTAATRQNDSLAGAWKCMVHCTLVTLLNTSLACMHLELRSFLAADVAIQQIVQPILQSHKTHMAIMMWCLIGGMECRCKLIWYAAHHSTKVF